MRIDAFTEEIADMVIRYSITYLQDSALIWVQAKGSETNYNGKGSMPILAGSMGQGRIGRDQNGIPAGMIILGDLEEGSLSKEWSKKLAKRYKIAIYSCVDIGQEGMVIAENILRRLLKELDDNLTNE